MSIVRDDPDDLLRIESLDLQYHGVGFGWDEDGAHVYSVLFRPAGMPPEAMGPDELTKVLFTPEELDDFLKAANSCKEMGRMDAGGEMN
jgi:hypothetical protein